MTTAQQLMAQAQQDQANAWQQVYMALHQGNPRMSDLAPTGLGAVLAEIARLQAQAARS
jgi:hypothetical protein